MCQKPCLRLGLVGHWAPRGWPSRQGRVGKKCSGGGWLREPSVTSACRPGGQKLACAPLLQRVPRQVPARSCLGTDGGRGGARAVPVAGWRQRGAREAQPSAGSPVTPSARRALTPAGGLARPPAAGAARPCPSRCPRRCRTTSASSRTCSRPPCTRARGECGLRGGAAPAPGRCRLHAESAPPSTGQPGRPDGWQLCGSCQCHVSSYKTVLILANFNRQK